MLASTLTDRRVEVAVGNQNKVKYMATQLLAKFEENAPPQSTGARRQVSPSHTSPVHAWSAVQKEGSFQGNEGWGCQTSAWFPDRL